VQSRHVAETCSSRFGKEKEMTQPAGSNPQHPAGVQATVDLLAEARTNVDLGVGYTVEAGNRFGTAQRAQYQIAQAYGTAQTLIGQYQVPLSFAPPPAAGQPQYPYPPQGQPQACPTQGQPQGQPPQAGPYHQQGQLHGANQDYVVLGALALVGILVGWVATVIVRSLAHGHGNFVHDTWFLLLMMGLFALLFLALGNRRSRRMHNRPQGHVQGQGQPTMVMYLPPPAAPAAPAQQPYQPTAPQAPAPYGAPQQYPYQPQGPVQWTPPQQGYPQGQPQQPVYGSPTYYPGQQPNQP